MSLFDQTPESIIIDVSGTQAAVTDGQTVVTASQPIFVLGGVRPDGSASFVNLTSDGGVKISVSGSGLIGGVSSSTDNAVVRWDGDTGSAIQDSNAILDDAGNLALTGTLTLNAGANQFTFPTADATISGSILATDGAGNIQFTNDKTPVFVYRPGEPLPDVNVYTDWPTMVTALSGTQGPKTIFVDDSLVSPAGVPPGTYDLREVTILGTQEDFFPPAELALSGGVRFLNLKEVRKNVRITHTGATPAIILDGEILFLDESATIASTNGPLIDVTSGTGLIFLSTNAGIGSPPTSLGGFGARQPVVHVSGSGILTLLMQAGASNLEGLIEGDSGATGNVSILSTAAEFIEPVSGTTPGQWLGNPWNIVFAAEARFLGVSNVLFDLPITSSQAQGVFDELDDIIFNLSSSLSTSVEGPGSSTDNALVRWDGTTGTFVQDSNTTLSDNNEMVIPSTAGVAGLTVGSGSFPIEIGLDAAGIGFIGRGGGAGAFRLSPSASNPQWLFGNPLTDGGNVFIDSESATAGNREIIFNSLGGAGIGAAVSFGQGGAKPTVTDNTPLGDSGRRWQRAFINHQVFDVDVFSGAGNIDDATLVVAQPGTYTLTLPTASIGFTYIFERQGNTGTVTLAPSGSNTINGVASSTTLGANTTYLAFAEDATDWRLVDLTTATPGGDDTEIQFNDNGVLTGSNALTWDGTTIRVTGSVSVTGEIRAAGDIITSSSLQVIEDATIEGDLIANVGGDLTGTLPTPQVVAFTSGATQITFDNIVAGEVLQRSGNTIISVASGTLIPLATTLPVAVSRSTALVGTSERVARADHRHDILTGIPSALTPDLPNFIGSAASLARSDHIHNVPAATAISISLGGVDTEGTTANFARADHTHRIEVVTSEVSAASVATTTSTSPQLVPSMVITINEAGKYIVWFSFWGGHANNNAELLMGLSVDGSFQNNTERRWGGTNQSDDVFATLATQGIFDFSTGQAVSGVFWRNAGSGAVFAVERSLTIMKVSD